MGMYDIINGEQVKCFGVPCYYDGSIEKGVSQMGGLLRGYKNGNKVPYKTYYYNYGLNFCIIDTHPYEEEQIAIIHIIENGKVKKTILFEDLTNEDLEKAEKLISYYGEELNIKTKEEVLTMIDDAKYFREQQNILTKNSHKILFEDIHLLTKDIRNYKEESKEYKEKKKELDSLYIKYEKLKNQEWSLVDDLREKRISIYYKEHSEMFYKCEKLGEYIDAEISYYKRGSEPEKIEAMKDYIFEAINDKELVKAYCEFQEISLKQFESIIRKISNQK